MTVGGGGGPLRRRLATACGAALHLAQGRLAQLVEHLVYTERVGGSSPSPPTSSNNPDAVMFPDPTLKCRPYPSEIDGIYDPFVLDRGLWKGALHLIVLEGLPGRRARGVKTRRSYGVKIGCQIYWAIEEMIYSIAKHSDGSLMYRGDVYIKEAEHSR